MPTDVTKTLVWAIGGERVPAYLKIRNASVEELCEIKGITEEIAKKLKEI